MSADPLPDEMKVFSGEMLCSVWAIIAPTAGNFTGFSIFARPATNIIVTVESCLVATNIAGRIEVRWSADAAAFGTPINSQNSFRDARAMISGGLNITTAVTPTYSNAAALPTGNSLETIEMAVGLTSYQRLECLPVIMPPADGTLLSPAGWSGALCIFHQTVTTPTLGLRMRYRYRPAEPTELVA